MTVKVTGPIELPEERVNWSAAIGLPIGSVAELPTSNRALLLPVKMTKAGGEELRGFG